MIGSPHWTPTCKTIPETWLTLWDAFPGHDWRWVGGSNVKMPGRGESSAAGPIACGTWCSVSPFATPGVPCGSFHGPWRSAAPVQRGTWFLGPLFSECRLSNHRGGRASSATASWSFSLQPLESLARGGLRPVRRGLADAPIHSYQVLENQGRGYGHELKAHPGAGESSVGVTIGEASAC